MKFAVLGTAQTWPEAPFQDASWMVGSLNDAYMLGLPRFDVWFEMHPLDKFVYRKRDARHSPVTPNDIPPGHYLRPEGHLHWLKETARDKPVLMKDTPPPGWGKAERYPLERIIQKYDEVLFPSGKATWEKPYSACGPTWMVLWGLDQGAEEIGCWGIHLATEREYIEQRPQFESLLMWCIAKGIRVTLPPTCPLLKSKHVYCYEPRLSQAQDPLRYQLSMLDRQRQPLVDQLVHRSWWQGKQSLLDQIAEIDAQKMDIKQQLTRLGLEEMLAGAEFRV